MDLSKAIDNFIAEADGDPARIAKIAEEHRRNRNERFEQSMLQPDYAGVPIDEILTARLNDPMYLDPRNNLCLFAWPSQEVIELISQIQQELKAVAPNLWISPPEWLHMTVIELVHSKSPPELKASADKVKPHAANLTAFGAEHPAGLNRPMLSLDDTAVALTFLPVDDSPYTYLHLRRDLSNLCAENDVEVASKYYNTSSHITLARFANISDLNTRESLEAWVQKVKAINQRLREDYWPREGKTNTRSEFKWMVGTGRGIEVRKGRLWYGDGQPVDFEESGHI
ncbi:unnamed protein product [Discula destructiva]